MIDHKGMVYTIQTQDYYELMKLVFNPLMKGY